MLSLVMPFLNESADFSYGFECGKLYQEMRQGKLKIEGSFHQVNYQQFVLMANLWGYKITKCTFQDGDVWVMMKFQLMPVKRLRKKLNQLMEQVKRSDRNG